MDSRWKLKPISRPLGADNRKKNVKLWVKGRIAYFRDNATREFWDNRWKHTINKDYYKAYEKGELAEYPYFETYLQPSDRILEAGCGTSRYVVALIARGYSNIEGIDWGEQSIYRVKEIYPNLPVRVGDVSKVDVMDGYYDGYISLGVMEHSEKGPDDFIKEAQRILKPNGYAFISVPYINSLRQIKKQLGFYKRQKIKGLSFYQYAYSKNEFQGILEKAGFDVFEIHGIAGSYGIRDEFATLFRFIDCLPGSWKINRWLKRFDSMDSWGHMILFICKKRIQESQK